MEVEEKKVSEEKKIWGILEKINDPEIPVLTIIDLGIIRSVKIAGLFPHLSGEVCITPTYSGCPAMDMIQHDIEKALADNGYGNVIVKTVLSPAWTTDWMSEQAREKLRAYGIAPPLMQEQVCTPEIFQEDRAVPCPRCNSLHTTLISKFGSTPCKALYRCEECKEPFDYFKCH